MNNIHEHFEDAVRIFSGYAGVRAVGIGLKEVNGLLTDQLVYRVYVTQKLPEAQLSREDIVPAELFGFPTDVLVDMHQALQCGQTRPLVGGIAVSTWDVPFVSPPGSIGCIAVKAPDKFILSNEHVLGVLSTNSGSRVYQPAVSECAGFYYNEVAANARAKMDNVSYDNGSGARDYYIDCAVAKVKSDVSTRNAVRGISQPINGHLDISNFTSAQTQNYAVTKSGSRTGVTAGIIEDVAYTDVDFSEYRKVVIRPNPGTQHTEVCRVRPEDKASILAAFASEPLVAVTDLGDNRLQFVSTIFSYPGDSGSVILNTQNQVVALLYAGAIISIPVVVDDQMDRKFISTGKTFACHIGPVLAQLDVNILSGAFPTSGEPVVVPDPQAAETERTHLHLWNLQASLSRHVKGELFLKTIRTHFPELVELVHHRRAVMATWHRHKGPSFMAIFVRAINNPDVEIERECDGIALPFFLVKMRDVLLREGSGGLRTDLQRWGDDILHLAASRNLHDAINCFS